MQVTFRSIGIIKSSHKTAQGTPIQPVFATNSCGIVEIFPEFVPGLQDIQGFERIWLIYLLHKACLVPESLTVTPFLDSQPHGVFAARSPCRPNAIGLSSVRLLRVENNILHVSELDILDNTPLLDIKPYVPKFDSFQNVKHGWFEGKFTDDAKLYADERFAGE